MCNFTMLSSEDITKGKNGLSVGILYCLNMVIANKRYNLELVAMECSVYIIYKIPHVGRAGRTIHIGLLPRT